MRRTIPPAAMTSAKEERLPRWFCAPEVENRQYKSQRHPNAAGHATPGDIRLGGLRLSHAALPATAQPLLSPLAARSKPGLHRDGRCASCCTRSEDCVAPRWACRKDHCAPAAWARTTQPRERRNAAARCMGPVSPPMKRLGAPRQRNQFSDRTLQRHRHSAAGATYCFGQRFFSGTMVDQHRHATLCQRPRHRAERLRRPALCSPSRTGIEDRQRLAATHFRLMIGPGFAGGINRKWRLNVFQRLACKLRRQRQRVLDHVAPLARRWHGCRTCAPGLRAAATTQCGSQRRWNAPPAPSVSRPAGRARPRISLRALRAGTTAISRHVSRDNSALRQLENLATCTQSASGLRSERAPSRSESRAHSNSAQRSSTSHPICRSGLARRKAAIAGMRVNDVAHGAESHHQEPVRRGDGGAVFARAWESAPAAIRECSPLATSSAPGLQSRQKVGSGMILGIANNLDPSAIGQDLVALGNVLCACSQCPWLARRDESRESGRARLVRQR